MQKSNSYGLYLLIALFVLMLAFYLRGNLETIIYQKYEMEEYADKSFFNMSVLVMSLLGSAFIFYNKSYFKRDSAMTRILVFMTWISLISFLRSVVVPLDSLLYYLIIPLNIVVISFFYISVHKVENKLILLILMALLFVYLLVHYIQGYSILTLFIGMNDVLMNSSYFILLLLPVLLLLPNSYIKLLLFIITMAVIVFSNKRTGTIAFSLSLFCYVLVSIYIQPRGMKRMIANFAVFLIAVIFVVYLFQNIDTEFYFTRFSSIEEDGGSGRDLIWLKSLNMIESSNFLDLLIGHGWNMVSKDSLNNLSAHCDFIEVMYDFGVIGFILYLNIYVTLFKVVKKLIKRKSVYAAPAVFSFISIFILSLTSHIVIYPYLSFITFSFWGILLSLNNQLKADECKIK